MLHHAVWQTSTKVSEKHAASICSVEQAVQEKMVHNAEKRRQV